MLMEEFRNGKVRLGEIRTIRGEKYTHISHRQLRTSKKDPKIVIHTGNSQNTRGHSTLFNIFIEHLTRNLRNEVHQAVGLF